LDRDRFINVFATFESVLAVKAAKQNIQIPQIGNLLDNFRRMVNETIRIGLERNITSRFRLQKEVYPILRNDLHTWYILTAVEKASAILRHYRKTKRKTSNIQKPYVEKPFLSVAKHAYKIIDGNLRLPIKPKQYFYIPLNKHTLSVLSEPNLKLGSVTLTANTVSISFSKETAEIEPSGYIGIDRNLDNVTTASSNGEIKSYDLSKTNRIKATYREVKSHFKRNDTRIRGKIFRKYGKKQSDKVNQILHRVSKEIVDKAKAHSFGIAMENLKGIRKLYRKGNSQGKQYRAKMNSWSFYELQRQIEYKAKWVGIPVIYVPARNTSKKCSICGLNLMPEENRLLQCSLHGTVDRDVNAAKNILARALRFKADGQPSEGMVAERQS